MTLRDFGNDFLVTRDKLGKNKAGVLHEMLVEMNPDTKGAHIEQSLD